jgi:methylase of polypeptide subunit release factors
VEDLEVGCGRGEFALWLVGVLPEVEITAVDFFPAAIEIARKHAAERWPVKCTA